MYANLVIPNNRSVYQFENKSKAIPNIDVLCKKMGKWGYKGQVSEDGKQAIFAKEGPSVTKTKLGRLKLRHLRKNYGEETGTNIVIADTNPVKIDVPSELKRFYGVKDGPDGSKSLLGHRLTGKEKQNYFPDNRVKAKRLPRYRFKILKNTDLIRQVLNSEYLKDRKHMVPSYEREYPVPVKSKSVPMPRFTKEGIKELTGKGITVQKTFFGIPFYQWKPKKPKTKK